MTETKLQGEAMKNEGDLLYQAYEWKSQCTCFYLINFFAIIFLSFVPAPTSQLTTIHKILFQFILIPFMNLTILAAVWGIFTPGT